MALTTGPAFVVFPARPQEGRPEWWHAILARGWRHVFAAQASALPGITLVLSHEGRHLRLGFTHEAIDAFVPRIAAETQARVLQVVPPAHVPQAMLRPPMTCVEATKAWLGIVAPLVLTPRQLFRHLMRRHDAVLVLDHATTHPEDPQ